jgi:hypothetical protein
MTTLSAIPSRSTSILNIASAAGERQIFPRQTKSIRVIFFVSILLQI